MHWKTNSNLGLIMCETASVLLYDRRVVKQYF